MKTHKRSKINTAVRSIRDCCLSMLLCVVATNVYATAHFIDMTSCDSSPPPATDFVEIQATSGTMLNDTIEVQNAAGPVTWIFDEAPPLACGVGPFVCNGVAIALPASMPTTDPVTVQGTPGNGGTFSFILEVADGTNTCFEGYELVISQPFDLVFVLDRSGSMGWDADPGNPGTSRWDALKTGVMGTTMVAGLTSEVVSNVPPVTSNFGLTLFATDVLANNSFASGLVPISGSLPTDVDNELNSQAPGGWTHMGNGLKNGEAKMTDCSRPRVVVLFTDGEQNQSPEVSPDGTTYTDMTPVRAHCTAAGEQAVEIVSVGILQASSPYLSTLQSLATNNGGNQTIITTTGLDYTLADGVTVVGDIAAAFQSAIVPALSGNSPQLVANYTGGLSGAVTLPAFDVNALVEQLLIQFTFNRRFETPQLAQLLAGIRIEKGGTDVTEFFRPAIAGNFENTFTLHTDFAHPSPDSSDTLTPSGSYTVHLTEPPNFKSGLEYRVVSYVDDHRLDMEWQVTPAAPRVNQAFEPAMTLSWRNRPVTNADVEAWILKPGDDLGDLLANDPTTVDVTGGTDAASPGEQKLQRLLETDPQFLAKLKANELHHTLTHKGDGVYSVSFDPGDVSGVYQIVYRVRADDPAFGKIQRMAVQSVYTRFGDIDYERSVLGGTVSGTTVTLDLRPITTYGKFVGPGNASAIKVEGAGNTLTSISDDQDGSYTMVIDGDPGSDITVSILGEEFYQGKAEDAISGGQKGILDKICEFLESIGLPLPCWLALVLIVVLLLLLLWLILRLPRGNNP